MPITNDYLDGHGSSNERVAEVATISVQSPTQRVNDKDESHADAGNP